MPCPYNIILGRDTALPSPLSSPRVQPELISFPVGLSDWDKQ
ncbi:MULTISPECIES: hypothetical protein [Microcoleaceae]|nr:hypothetical protein [Tychonema sp. LEGE 06208]